MVADCSITGNLALGGNLALSGAYNFSVGGILQSTSTSTITRNTATLTAGSLSVKAAQTQDIRGASGLSIASLYIESGGIFIFPASQTLTVSTSVSIAGTSINRCAIRSGTASTKFSLTYTGTSANMNLDEIDATDVTFSAPNVNGGIQIHGAGTLLRTTGAVNYTVNPGDNVPPAVTDVRSGTSYWLNGSNVTGTYNPLVALADITTAAQTENINATPPTPSTPPIAKDYLFAVLAGVIP
jgi:hypothetical protein